MTKHYFKIVFRNMRKYKTQLLTGIFGLAFGLACFVPSLYWLRYETSYDSFYPDAENIYRLYAVEKQSGKVDELIPGIVARKLHEHLPTVEAYACFYPEINTCSAEGMPYIRLRTLNADSTFFGVFKQEFVSGDALKPLQVMYNIVLTETMAIRLFGDVEKSIGQQLQSTFYFFNPPYTVTAVVKDPPTNTNLPFDAILFHDLLAGVAKGPEEYQWMDFCTQTYIKFHSVKEIDELSKQVRELTARLNENITFEPMILPVSEVRHRLNAGAPFTLNYIRLFFYTGILLIFSALFNFLNLHAGFFRQRINEFRQRTVHGAKSLQLMLQMMFELAFSILLSMALACIFVIITRPVFSGLLGLEISLSSLMHIFITIGTGVVLLILIIGMIPFWRMSRLALRRWSKARIAVGQPLFRRASVTLQVAVSVVFIVAVSVVMLQMRYVNHKDMGFDRKGIIQLHGLPPYMQTSLRTALIHELEAIPQIDKITTSNFEPKHNANTLEMITVVEWAGKSQGEKPAFNVIPTDSRFAETLGLKMLMGAWWDESGGANKIVLNEEAVQVMGLNEPIGTVIRMSIANVDLNEAIEEYEIVGVVKDFHTLSLRSPIMPTIFRPSWSNSRIVADNILYVHVTPGREKEAMQRIMDILPAVDATMTGVSLTPINELYNRFNQSEQAGLQLFAVIATVCLLISLIGIYAVATDSSQRRRKEIAIRKVVGAEVWDIVCLFFREHTLQVIIADIIAFPLVYYAMHRWMQGYAYRTNIPWWLLPVVITVVIVIVLLTVLGQTLKAANSNPAEVVKSE